MSTAHLLCLIFISIFLGNKVLAQKSMTYRVLDFEKGTPVEDVSVKIIDTDRGAYSDEKGFFILDKITDRNVIILSKLYFSKKSLIHLIC